MYYVCANAMSKGAEATKPRRFCCRSRSPRSLPLLRGVQRLLGRPALSHSDAVITDVAEQLKLDLQGLLDAWLLKRGQISPGPHEVPRLFDRYLQAATLLTRAVEQLPQSGQR